jgi:hypothetical protein
VTRRSARIPHTVSEFSPCPTPGSIAPHRPTSSPALAVRGPGDPPLAKLLAAVGGWADAGIRVLWPWVGAEAVLSARADARVLPPELLIG